MKNGKAADTASLALTPIPGKCDVNKLNKKGLGPLYIAACKGHTGIVEQLLRTNVNKNETCTSDEYTPLIISVVNERLSVARLLLKVAWQFV